VSAHGLGAAIVDLDGTLVDTLGDFEVALNLALAELALPPVDRAFIGRTVGKGSAHLLRSALAAAGGDAASYDLARVHYQRYYRAVNGTHSTVYAGAEAGLGRLRAAGLALACVTNKPHEFAVALLERMGLAPLFDRIYGGDSFARSKPDPLPLVSAAAVLGVPASRTLVVGDSTNDALAARAAGCPLVLVRYGYNHGQPIESAGADALVDRLDEIDLDAWRLPALLNCHAR
jgi:phosphoglycolate phosphatase